MATHHVRHLSHPSKKSQSAHARPSRPLSKRLHSQGKAAPKPSSSKEADLVCAQAKHIDDVDDDDDQDSMAVSFLNYCTVCEKQIVVPSNTVLYCSESCKKRDAEKSIHDYYYDHYSPPTTPFANFSFDDFTFRDIVPQRSPTQPDSKRSSCAFSDVSSDEHSDNHYHSDASKFLRKFYSTPAPSDASRQHRPRYSRTSTSQYSTSAAPSLSHTPASSVSYSLPYTPATTRPLPPRTKSSRHGSYGGKSIDLVTPVTAPSSPKSYSHKSPAVSRTSVSTIEGEIVYAKSPVPEPSVASSSLGRLLASSPQHHA